MVNWGKIIFGGVDSSEYGIYITGEAVYNSPERDVEFVEVPGRNGAIAIDKGRYKNITVTYPAGTFGKSQSEFSEALSEFRNAILSQVGYQKLEDTYHPEEYRLAVYVAGLEVSPVAYGQAGEFELIFECKPQRWLSVGEYPIPLDSGDILQNPTQFDASPLLEIYGNGHLSFNEFDLELEDITMGETAILAPDRTEMNSGDTSRRYDVDPALFEVGDTITIRPCVFRFDFVYNAPITSINVTNTASNVTPTITNALRGPVCAVNLSFPSITYEAPANGAFEAFSYMGTMTVQLDGGGQKTATIIAQVIGYGKDGDRSPSIAFIASVTINKTDPMYLTHGTQITETGAIVDSSVRILGNPTFIDCELGEAYKVENEVIISLNNGVSMGADLPVLSPGGNKVTFDNTITELKISPRWWRI